MGFRQNLEACGSTCAVNMAMWFGDSLSFGTSTASATWHNRVTSVLQGLGAGVGCSSMCGRGGGEP